MIHYYYGYGKGKTSSAIGAGMRAAGAGMSVLIVRFLKDSNSSELSVLPFTVYPTPEKLPFNPDKSYCKWVDSAVEYVKNKASDMVILDEFSDVIGKYIDENRALDLINSLNSEVIVTGHKENKNITEISDYVTYFESIKHPYEKGAAARKGIEF